MYYVKIKDDFDHEITVEVLLEVYQVFDDERKLLERERYEHRKHWDKRGIEDYILADHSTALSESAEEIFFCRETFREIREVLKTCTSVQRKRFILHFFDGNSYAKNRNAKLHSRHRTQIHTGCAEKAKKYPMSS